MCAIAGVVGLDVNQNIIENMEATMKRRGPDQRGVFSKCDCTLLHSRLTIIDPDGGTQPMHVAWGNEIFTIVYNGELYNTEELREVLENSGHRFVGYSDTEVVLHAYAQWEDRCLEKFNGIFAFAIWEHKRQKLFLARDRIGVKPLFYALKKNGIVFASEIKTILQHPEIPPQINAESVIQIMMLGPGRLPGSGVFCNIYELEPGCFGWYCNEKWRWKRYWKLSDREHRDSFAQTVEKVRYLVTDSIKRQMISDMPVGTFLSGGLDSSIISTVCAEEMRRKGQQLRTFSVDYKNNDKYFVPGKFQPTADSYYINLMCDYIKSEHSLTVLTPDDLVDVLNDATFARDLPGMADVDFSLLSFCKEIRKDVKVALSGECADEIFGGYPWYRDPEVRAADGFPWAQNTVQRASFVLDDFCRQVDPQEYVMDAYLDTVRQSDVLPGTSDFERRMKEMVNLNFRWFMQTLLDRKDRMSMYHGLEVRVPFCDFRIAEYLYGVPWEFKDYKRREKGLLREAMTSYLPEEILFRKKSPYPKTHDPRYLKLVFNQLHHLLQCKDAPLFNLVDKKALSNLLTSDFLWPWYGQLMRKPQTIAYMLQINTWMTAYNIQIV